MDECIEILSDSSTSSRTVGCDFSEELQKILGENCIEDNKGGKANFYKTNQYDLDISDDEFIFEPLETRLNKNQIINNKEQVKDKPSTSSTLGSGKPKSLYDLDSCSEDEDISNKFSFNFKESFKKSIEGLVTETAIDIDKPVGSYKSSEEELDLPKPKKRQKKTILDKELEKLEKEKKKEKKAEERELKKQQKENEKQMKNALKVVENCVRPDQCGQYITVNIDENLANKPYGKVIVAGLENGGYKHKILKQCIQNGMTWTRAVPKLENMMLKNVFQDENYFLSVLEIYEFIPMIANQLFTRYVQSILSLPNIKHATTAILDVEKYYKYLENEKNRQFRAAVLDTDKKQAKNKQGFENLPVVKKYELDMALTQLQILSKNCYVKFVDTFEDLAVFVGECSKAVAQAPYKAEKAEKAHKSEEFFQGHNKDCVKIDKDGNGLSRLWSQILRCFPLATLETSEAILKVYPSLKSLVEAYRRCSTEKEKQCLLQDIQVRRAAGPLANARRIGPEMSRKYYVFFCQRENVLI